jgi:hypothetical protein
MKKTSPTTLLLVFLVYSSLCIAQQSDLILLYKISPDEARELYRDGEIEDHYFNDLYESYNRDQIIDPTVGHYLQVEALAEDIKVELKSVHSFQTNVIPNNRDLLLQIADSTGQWITDATVLFNGKPVSFQSTTNSYFKKKSRKDGWVEVQHQGEVAFYSLKNLRRRYKPSRGNRRFVHTTTGRIISTPVRLGKRAYRKLRSITNSIVYRSQRRKIVAGYIALNKPIYRPGDTLHLKAYVVNKYNKPWKDSLILQIAGSNRQVFTQKRIAPQQAGSFSTSLVLGDSLQPSLDYYIRLKEVDKDSDWIYHTFKIEDYELDQFSLEVKPSKKIFTRQENPTLIVRALGANGLPTTNGKIDIVFEVSKIDAIYEDELLIADTLWRFQETLPAKEEVNIIMPSNSIPNADVHINAKIKYQAPDGQLINENCIFKIEKQREYLSLKLQDGFLSGRYYSLETTDTTTATLVTITNKGTIEEAITLPFNIPLNAFAIQYSLKKGSLFTGLSVRNHDNTIAPILKGSNELDSVQFIVENPYRLPFTYFIFCNKQLLEKGESANKQLYWTRRNKTGKNFNIKLVYTLRGVPIEGSIDLPYYKKQLQVSIDQPDEAPPNQETMVVIEVLRNNGKPASDVNVSAGAYRSQFAPENNLRLPEVQYKEKKKARSLNRYKISPKERKVFPRPLSTGWFQKLQLKGQQFYALRLPKQGVYLHYDTIGTNSFYQQIAQFAPFVIKGGKEQLIWLAYLDDQLIYYGGMYKDHPYSFTGKPGGHKLTIRTKDREYTLDGILLKKGQKLVLAIDEDNYAAHQSGLKIKHRAMPDYLLYHELRLLRNNMMEIKNISRRTDNYLWRDSTNVFYIPKVAYSSGRPFVIGPITRGDTLQFVQKGEFTAKLIFEPGFSYDIQRDRDRLYSSTSFDPDTEVEKKVQALSSFHSPDDLVFDPGLIAYTSEARPKFQLEGFDEKRDNHAYGQYWISYTDSLLDLMAIVIRNEQGQGKLFNNHARYFNELQAGAYEIFLINQSGTYAKKAFSVHPDTTLCQSLESIAFSADSTSYLLQQFFLTDTLYSQEDLSDQFEYLKTQSILTLNRPYLLSGQVVDKSGEPIIFGSVVVHQNGILVGGTSTDFDGYYEIAIPPGLVDVEVSYIGYESHRVTSLISNNSRLDISLEGSSLQLSEVVVVSYSKSPATHINNKRSTPLEIDRSTAPPTDLTTSIDRFSGLRSDFRDYAYFAPTLMTDKEGKAYLTPHLPGTLSNWESFALGMDKKGRAGATFSTFKTYKPLTAELFLPRFMLTGDQAIAKGQISNFSGDELPISTQFIVDGQQQLANNLIITEGTQEQLPITAPDKDSLHLQYQLETEGYLDGEKRDLPIFPVGTKVSEGYFALLSSDTSIQWSFDDQKGPVYLRAEGTIRDLLMKDLAFLKNQPYQCNEQTASRLMAYLIERGWQQEQGLPVTATDTILTLLGKLQKAQNPSGAWGWWPKGASNNWMTIYVLKALWQAKYAGFDIRAFEVGLRYLVAELPLMPTEEQLSALELLVDMNYNIDYARYIQSIDSLPLTVTDRLRSMYIAQQAGLAWSLDTLHHYKKTNLLGSTYWGNKNTYWRDNSIQASLIAYKILEKVDKKQLEPIRQYFLGNRQTGGVAWRNTFETAQILHSAFKDILIPTSTKVQLLINDQRYEDFPLVTKFPATNPLAIKLTGESPTYLTAYQQYHNPEPKQKGATFDISTVIKQNGKSVTELLAGQAAAIVATLQVDQAADYVMIEIPIPAGCSYAEESVGWNTPEVYRQYFRHKTAIFCEHLAPGTYQFQVLLEPRFEGSYTLNPARAELMYFPTFYGHNGINKVKIR